MRRAEFAGELFSTCCAAQPSRRPNQGNASDREMRANVVLFHGRTDALGDDFAARQHDVVIGERTRKIVILLHQEDRHVAPLALRHQTR